MTAGSLAHLSRLDTFVPLCGAKLRGATIDLQIEIPGGERRICARCLAFPDASHDDQVDAGGERRICARCLAAARVALSIRLAGSAT